MEYLLQNIYGSQLTIIDGMSFTRREVDVIACIVSGRSAKKIASLLTISPKTVENHTRNIMSKLGIKSQDNIIDFIEKSGKFIFVKRYYSNLLIQSIFEQELKKLSILLRGMSLFYKVVYYKENEDRKFLLYQLERHLKFSGIKVLVEVKEKYEMPSCTIDKENSNYAYYISDSLIASIQQFRTSDCIESISPPIFLLLNKDTVPHILQELTVVNYVNLVEQKNYYLSFFELLKKLIPNINLDKIILEFKEQCNTINDSSERVHVQPWSKNDKPPQTFLLGYVFKSIFESKKQKLTIISVLSLSVICILMLLFKDRLINYQKTQIVSNQDLIQSDLVVPAESSFLQRPDLINEINNKFTKRNDIQTIALIGIGGAGKTTIARYYARQQKLKVIWEINAETKENLKRAFEAFALALSKTEQDKKMLMLIQKIRNPIEREDKIIQFVKERLKSRSDWLLIYDNVAKFTDIQKYFPQNHSNWGQGKIILTTQDNNIQNNNLIDKVIFIGELNSNQKLDLFNKIMNNGDIENIPTTQIQKTERFLEEIPPFPLDVSIAAYYLRATNLSYKEYLENLHKSSKVFENIQGDILRDIGGNYVKTRYNIVSLSIKQIISSYKDFDTLLLFISLLDSQNIPRELLENCSKDILDKFIYHLKRFSLITTETLPSIQPIPVFSIHRSTQAIILAYLLDTLDFWERKQKISKIAGIFEMYMALVVEEEDTLKMKITESHCKMFLNHKNLLSNEIQVALNGGLGGIYHYLGNFKEAKFLLEESYINLKKSNNKNHFRISLFLFYMSSINKDLNNLNKSISLLEEALEICKKYLPENHARIAMMLTHLGNIYRETGDYEKSISLLQQGFQVYKDHLPERYSHIIWGLLFLGYTYRDMGDYQKAKDFFEQSLIMCKDHLPENHVDVGWTLANLGDMYALLGIYDKARHLLEQGFIICKENLPEDHIHIGWVLRLLGSLYINLEDYDKAKDSLEAAFIICEKNSTIYPIRRAMLLALLGRLYQRLGKYEKAIDMLQQSLVIFEKIDNKKIETARALTYLGYTCFLIDQLESAEDFLNKSLEIFRQCKHSQVYMPLEDLAKLYWKRSVYELSKGNIEKSKEFKIRGILFLKEAQQAIQLYYPNNLTHNKRIQLALDSFEKENTH